MSNREIALELKSINRQQYKLAKALQGHARTRRKVDYIKVIFAFNVLCWLAFLLNNTVAKFYLLAR